jgi:hypothetical protein
MPVLQGLQYYNDRMLTLAEHWDEFIMDRTMKNPNIWHDRIPRGAYQLFSGLSQKSNIYRGGLPVQAGLNTWRKIGLSRKPAAGDQGYDNCAPGTPHTYSYAWETIQYEGYTDEWQSEPVCLEDLKFVDYAREQLALVVRSGVDYGISILENWNREMYSYFAQTAGRCVVLAEGALQFEDVAKYRFTYDPFATTTDVDGETVPYVSLDKTLKISTLNWSLLDYLRVTMSDRAGEAAIARDSGMAVFGLMIDMMDFERFVLDDPKLREDFRSIPSNKLISGYDFGMKTYRGFALIHDPRQMRFRFKTLDGANAIYTRVLPLRAGRAVTIGNVPEPNPEYYRAELATGVLFMNDVFQNLFVPSITNLGSGMSFGPAPGLTGEWKWINIPDPASNMLGNTGFFYGRFQVYPKPLLFSSETTVFLYRRCPHAVATECSIQTSQSTSAVTLAADAVAGDFDLTNRRVTVTLDAKIDAGIGDAVTVTHNGGATPMVVAGDALAPTYTVAWAAAAANAPTVYSQFVEASTVDPV